jgi:hypothetical protein
LAKEFKFLRMKTYRFPVTSQTHFSLALLCGMIPIFLIMKFILPKGNMTLVYFTIAIATISLIIVARRLSQAIVEISLSDTTFELNYLTSFILDAKENFCFPYSNISGYKIWSNNRGFRGLNVELKDDYDYKIGHG